MSDRHALYDDVEHSAQFQPRRNGPTSEQRDPEWWAHIRQCFDCAHNYLNVPADRVEWCPVGGKMQREKLGRWRENLAKLGGAP